MAAKRKPAKRRVWVKAHCRGRPEKAWQKADRSAREWGF